MEGSPRRACSAAGCGAVGIGAVAAAQARAPAGPDDHDVHNGDLVAPAECKAAPTKPAAPANTSCIGTFVDLAEHVTRRFWDCGTLVMVISGIFFAFTSFFVKYIGALQPSLSVFEIVLVRSCFALVGCFAALAHQRVARPLGHLRTLPLLLSRGGFGAACMVTYYYSVQMLPLADAMTIFFINPALTALLARLVLREALGWRGVGGIVLSVGGLVLLAHPPFIFHMGQDDWERKRVIGTALALVSALMGAGSLVSIRAIGRSEPVIVVAFWFHLSAFATGLIPVAAAVPSRAVLPSPPQWGLLFGIAFTSFSGQVLIGRGFQLLCAAKASAINLSQVVYSYILDVLVFHATMSWLSAIGSVLICAGALLTNLRRRKPKDGDAVAAAAESGDPGAALASAMTIECPGYPNRPSGGGGDGGDGCSREGHEERGKVAREDGGDEQGGSDSGSDVGAARSAADVEYGMPSATSTSTTMRAFSTTSPAPRSASGLVFGTTIYHGNGNEPPSAATLPAPAAAARDDDVAVVQHFDGVRSPKKRPVSSSGGVRQQQGLPGTQ